jgi:hypothetical protein
MSSAEAWLKSLAAPDRSAAQRLIWQLGEAKFARIARAYVQQPRSPGRPTQEARDKVLVVQAAILWMTDLRYANYGNAASAMARRARNGGSKRDLPATDKALARRIRERLETADAEFWKAAERQAASEGRLVRRSPNDAMDPAGDTFKVMREMQRRHAAVVGPVLGRHASASRQTFLNICAMADTSTNCQSATPCGYWAMPRTLGPRSTPNWRAPGCESITQIQVQKIPI